MSNIRRNIQTLVTDLLDQKGIGKDITDDSSLVTTGYLDSVDIIDIVVYLEREFNLDFADSGIDQTEFDSVNSIVEMVEQKLD